MSKFRGESLYARIATGYEAWYRRTYNASSAINDGDQVVAWPDEKSDLPNGIFVQGVLWAEVPKHFVRYI